MPACRHPVLLVLACSLGCRGRTHDALRFADEDFFLSSASLSPDCLALLSRASPSLAGLVCSLAAAQDRAIETGTGRTVAGISCRSFASCARARQVQRRAGAGASTRAMTPSAGSEQHAFVGSRQDEIGVASCGTLGRARKRLCCFWSETCPSAAQAGHLQVRGGRPRLCVCIVRESIVCAQCAPARWQMRGLARAFRARAREGVASTGALAAHSARRPAGRAPNA